MTQPTSVDMTFDTSLVDVKSSIADINASFSTVESDQTTNIQSKPTPLQTPSVRHIATQDAYDQWASVYDSDGNMLQAIDDIELATLLPDFLAQVANNDMPADDEQLRILDLGCGTGRNTLKLLEHDFPGQKAISILGLDFSQSMLDMAQTKLSALSRSQHEASGTRKSWALHCCDVFASPLPPSSLVHISPAHAIVSTLVLEHVPLAAFFSTLAALLLHGGVALVTNMHHDMGNMGSQAGFVNADGVKVRGSSSVYTVEEMVWAAGQAGLEVLWVREREVREEDVDGEGARVGSRGRKWVGVKVWVGVMVRRVG